MGSRSGRIYSARHSTIKPVPCSRTASAGGSRGTRRSRSINCVPISRTIFCTGRLSAGCAMSRPRPAFEKVSELMREPVFVSDNQPALTLSEELRRAPHHAAMVTDEFGIVRGLVTIEDLAEEIVGDLTNRAGSPDHPQIRETAPQAWIVDGMAEIDAVNHAIPDFETVSSAEEDSFQTLAGFIMQHLERLPREGETFTVGQFQIEIIDMDRQRIDKVGVRRIDAPTDPAVAQD